MTTKSTLQRLARGRWLLPLLMAALWSLSVSADSLIDVNTASATELQQLPGIGASRAQAIVQYRETHGPFHSVDALLEVRGIGPSILERIRGRVSLGSAPRIPSQAVAGDRQDATTQHRTSTNIRERSDHHGFDLDLTREDSSHSFADRRRTTSIHDTREREAQQPSRGFDAPRQVPTPAVAPPSGLVNLNTASEEVLTTLPGIGPARARAIIAHRSSQGPFTNVESITEVSGIGPAISRNIRDRVTVMVDLNAAGLEELEAIGIDMDAAEKILRWRASHGPFRSVEDITLVPGFGRGALETLRPLLYVD